MKRWCGASAWRTAVRLLSSGVTIEVRDEKGSASIHLNPINVGCRFLVGTGLDGAIVSGGDSKSTKSLVAAAVIALKAKYGEPLPSEETIDATLGEEKGAPRTRIEVLATAKTLLEMAIAAGLSHSGASSAERFATLAVSANGTNLPRLAHELKTVAEELGMIATRHGRADAERTLEVMAHAYALVTALNKGGMHPPAHLVGQHRTGYVDVHTLQLMGITGFTWQARSGFRGITLLFWDAAEKRWASWTEARSVSSDPRYDPLKAFDADAPWASDLSVRNLVSRHVQLSKARRNAFGRLSATKACKATVLAEVSPGGIDFGRCAFSSWEDLAHYVASTSASGLKQADPMADWVVLAPTRWGDRHFDRVEQRLSWTVDDETGRQLTLALMYSDMTRHGVEALEAWEPTTRSRFRILGRVLRNIGEFAVEPVALLPIAGNNSATIHLLIPPPTTNKAVSTATNKILVTAPDDDEELEGEAEDDGEMHSTNRWLRRVRDHLVGQAEAGAADTGLPNLAQNKLLVQKLSDAGLPILSHALVKTEQNSSLFSEWVLKGAYLVRLHEQCQIRSFSPSDSR
jgi:hypothetical protein